MSNLLRTTSGLIALSATAFFTGGCGNDLSVATTSTTRNTESTVETDTTAEDTDITLDDTDMTFDDTEVTFDDTDMTFDDTEMTLDDTDITLDDTEGTVSAGEDKAGMSRDDFIEEFVSGFGTSSGIETAKIECVGGEVYDGLSEESLQELGENGLDNAAEPPQSVKDAFAPAFADCLDFGDLLAAAGSLETEGMDTECLTSTVSFTREDEIEFWEATLNNGTPPSTFTEELTSAMITCS